MDLISGMRVFVSIADNGSLAKAGRELEINLTLYLLLQVNHYQL